MVNWKIGKPDADGIYIVNSTWGVRAASYSKDFGACFQDIISNQDEGMPDWSGFFSCEFHVSHWMELPTPPKEDTKICRHDKTHYSQRWGEHICSNCGESVQCVGYNTVINSYNG